MWDYKRLALLGSGVLNIDVKNKQCEHNGTTIEELHIASVLHDWLMKDLESNDMKVDSIEIAELSVKFATERQEGSKIKNSIWADPTPYFVHGFFECGSLIRTQERDFTSTYKDEKEWPESYSWIR